MFLKNAWYAVSWSKDLTSELFARRILDEPVVIYRTPSGELVALEDRCCHRAAPLSKGRLLGDVLECGYHGLQFDTDGRCVDVPSQKHVPAATFVRKYPLVDKWNLLWIWMGEPANADESKIPNLYWMNDPAWCVTPGYIHLKANYQLLVDNLLDFTHLSYVHRATLAGDDREKSLPMKMERIDDGVRVSRWITDGEPPPLFARAGNFNGLVDRWQFATWKVPSTVYIDVGCAKAGTGAQNGDRSHGITLWSNHLITPETETTTHYLFSYARNFEIHNPDMSRLLFEGSRQAFLEDTVMIEAQQLNMNGGKLERMMNITSDANQLEARRKMAKLIEAEAAAEIERELVPT